MIIYLPVSINVFRRFRMRIWQASAGVCVKNTPEATGPRRRMLPSEFRESFSICIAGFIGLYCDSPSFGRNFRPHRLEKVVLNVYYHELMNGRAVRLYKIYSY